MIDMLGSADEPFKVFEALAAGASYGQAEDQGMGNYYETDPVEKRNFDRFVDLLEERASEIGRRVLVAACGDGLETEILLRRGFEVVATDFSPNMVRATARHLEECGLEPISVSEADVTNLNLDSMPHDFAGVSFAQAAQFIEDNKLPKVISDLSRLTPRGVVFISTTQYEDPAFIRQWAPNGEIVGSTIYRGRPLEEYRKLCEKAGLEVVHTEFFDAGSTPPDDYKNAYIIGMKP